MKTTTRYDTYIILNSNRILKCKLKFSSTFYLKLPPLVFRIQNYHAENYSLPRPSCDWGYQLVIALYRLKTGSAKLDKLMKTLTILYTITKLEFQVKLWWSHTMDGTVQMHCTTLFSSVAPGTRLRASGYWLLASKPNNGVFGQWDF